MEIAIAMKRSPMKNSAAKMRRAIASDSGTEVAEMAAIIPVLFMLVIGIFWFGQAYRIYGTLAHAARAGARAAVAPACTTCAAATSSPGQIAQTAVINTIAAANLTSTQLVPNSAWTRTPPTLCLCHSGTTSATCTQATAVACDATVNNVCVQENVQLSYPNTAGATGNFQGGMGTCGTSVSVRYQYPFHFRIPMTNLDLGNIQLPGQAEMRAETQ
jgi:Flp pilus assembly protein TadG